jgi:hypothetical protein
VTQVRRSTALKLLRREGWFERIGLSADRGTERIRATVTFVNATPDSASRASLLADEALGLVAGVTEARIKVRPKQDVVLCEVLIYPHLATAQDLRLLIALANEHTGRAALPRPCDCLVSGDGPREGEAA